MKRLFFFLLIPFFLFAKINNQALIIGINEYSTWPPLEFAVSDANLIKKILDNQEFGISTLKDEEATKENIFASLKNYENKKIHRLVIFFAGHGHTVKKESKKEGFLVPINAKFKEYDKYAISMKELKSYVKTLGVKHVLLVFDSCYSGLGLSRGGVGDSSLSGYLKEVDSIESIQILTAGRMGDLAQEKEGNGLFTKFFARAISGEADSNEDGVLTASEINQWVRPMVYTESQKQQLPMYGALSGEGEFLFTNISKEVNETSKRMKKKFIDDSKKNLEKIEKKRKIELKIEDEIFEKLITILGIENNDNSKSFLLRTLNFAVKPSDIKENINKNINKAKALNEEAVKLYTKYRKTWQKEYLSKAIKSYKKSLTFDNKNSQVYSNLALSFFRNKDFEYAVWAGVESIKKSNNKNIIASSLYNIGRVFESKRDFEQGIIFYLASMNLREKKSKTYNIVKTRVEGILRSQLKNSENKKPNENTWIRESKQLVSKIENKEYQKFHTDLDDDLFDRLVDILMIGNSSNSQNFLYDTLSYSVVPNTFEKLEFIYDKNKSKKYNKKGVKNYHKYRKTKAKKDLDNSITNYFKALSYDENNSSIYSNLALSYLRDKKHSFAIWAGLESIKKTSKKSTMAASLYNLGRCFEDKKQYKRALIFYIAALKLREKGKVYNIVKERIYKVYEKASS